MAIEDSISTLERRIDELTTLIGLLAQGQSVPAGSLPEGMTATGPKGETVCGTEFGPKLVGRPRWLHYPYPHDTLVTLG